MTVGAPHAGAAGGGGAGGAGGCPKLGLGLMTVGAPQGACSGTCGGGAVGGSGGGGVTTVGALHCCAGAAGACTASREPHCWQNAQSESFVAPQAGQMDFPAGARPPGASIAGVPGDGISTVAGMSAMAGAAGRTGAAAAASSGVAHMRQTGASSLFSAPHRGQVIIAGYSSDWPSRRSTATCGQSAPRVFRSVVSYRMRTS